MTKTTKQVDSKGRLNLGQKFANAQVILHEMADGITIKITKAMVVPMTGWLAENPSACAAVIEGLAQAKASEFADPPANLNEALWVDDLED